MSWNYRLVRHVDGTYGVHEVYYDNDGTPNGMSMDSVRLGSFDYDEVYDVESEGTDPKETMLEELEMIRAGLEKDIFVEPAHWSHGEDE